ncbi:MAG: threonylcarbamoyl-AMP synthase [Candidatus Doudnabacteria bacterium]|nr:threonylcarbamoyl-AMP synthase [Candidatus Doudnabacteria bacterium]
MNRISEAVKILKTGGIVVYPTDTAYGLAVDATNEKAVRKLYRVKGREFKKPIHVIVPTKYCNTVTYYSKIVRLNSLAEKLIRKFWPGPLTVVLPLKGRGKSWQILSAGTKTIGIRYPANLMAQALVEPFKRPITTTSANIAGKPDCYSTAEVKKQFAKFKYKPDFYLDGGKLPKRPPSTVVSLVGHVKILRQGPISEKEIKKALR